MSEIILRGVVIATSSSSMHHIDLGKSRRNSDNVKKNAQLLLRFDLTEEMLCCNSMKFHVDKSRHDFTSLADLSENLHCNNF
jgi:hypothetical protein